MASSTLYEYDDAKTACSNINMRIAVIDTATKQTFIENLGILADGGKCVYLHLAMFVYNLDQPSLLIFLHQYFLGNLEIFIQI